MSDQTRTATDPAGTAVHSPRAGGPPARTAWVGWIWFAAILMITIGLFNVVDGLVALFRGDLYTVTPNGLLVFDLTGWGWVHIVIGVLLVVVAGFLVRGATWARLVAVFLVVLNALAQLAFLPAFPVWAAIVIALDVLVVWAIVVHGDELAESR